MELIIILILFIIIVIYVLVCPSNKAVIIIICAQILGLMFCLYMHKNMKKEEVFYNPTKFPEPDKYNIEDIRNYEDLVHLLKKTDYDIESGNYDNSREQEDYLLDKPQDPVEDIIQSILDENQDDITVDYGTSSLGAEHARRNKQSLNIRSRFDSENFKQWHEEELDEAAERRWFDRDQLEFDF